MKRTESAPFGLKEAEELLDNAHVVREYIEKLYKIRKGLVPLALGNHIKEKDFYKLAVLLKSQAYSAMLKNYFIEKVGAEKLNRGDGDLLWNGVYYAYKVSTFNQDEALHVVQVRSQHKCDYIIQYVDERHLPPTTFQLTCEQMKEELRLCNASSAHGTMAANRTNENPELRFTIRIGSDDWNRWVKSYKITLPS